jgi:hypothetical protein
LYTLIGIAAILALVLTGVSGFLFLRSPKSLLHNGSSRTATTETTDDGKDFSHDDSVTYEAGEGGSTHGLTHLDQESDGTTMAHIVEGVPTRSLSLTNTRTTLNFYFKIHPTFKQDDLRTVRIEVEYLDPYEGTIGVHYDAMDLPGLANPDPKRAFRDTGGKTLTGANSWQTASFAIRDGGFHNRQNGGADFRVWAKAPTLYLRRVTVTRVTLPEEAWPMDYSQSNSASITLGEEKPEDGLRHLSEQGDGRTVVTNLDGVICRHMQRPGRGNGFLYFTINPSFKRDGLKNVRCEIEYYSPIRGTLRLQYDAVEFDTHRAYKSVAAENDATIRYGGGVEFTRVAAPQVWQTVTFRLVDGVFANSQNGGADMRLEVSPPDIYVRRVTVTRESAGAEAKP